MTCLEVQGLTTPFINDKLDPNKAEEFLNHVNHCEDCKEELEVYYTLLTGMRLLDEERNLSNNFHLDFQNKLKKAEDQIIKRKFQLIQKRVVLVIIMVAIAFLSNYGVGEYLQKDIVPSREYQVKGEYIIQNYYFENRASKLEVLFFQNYDGLIQHVNEDENVETN